MYSFKNKLDAVSSFSVNDFECLIEKLKYCVENNPTFISDLQGHGYNVLNVLFKNNNITFTEKVLVIDFLKEKGYNVNDYNPSIHAKNFLMEYIDGVKRKPTIEKITKIINLGVDINHASGYVLSALENAPYLLEGLVKLGADINKRYSYKYMSVTPLEYSILEGRLDYFKKLVELGADVKAINEVFSENLIHFLSLRLSNSSVKQLTDPEYAKFHVNVLKLLVEKGIDINAQNKEGNTALMAVYSDFLEIKKAPTILNEMIVKIHGGTNIENMLIDILKGYIEHGAKIDIKNNQGLMLIDVCPKAMPHLFCTIEKEMVNSAIHSNSSVKVSKNLKI